MRIFSAQFKFRYKLSSSAEVDAHFSSCANTDKTMTEYSVMQLIKQPYFDKAYNGILNGIASRLYKLEHWFVVKIPSQTLSEIFLQHRTISRGLNHIWVISWNDPVEDLVTQYVAIIVC